MQLVMDWVPLSPLLPSAQNLLPSWLCLVAFHLASRARITCHFPWKLSMDPHNSLVASIQAKLFPVPITGHTARAQ